MTDLAPNILDNALTRPRPYGSKTPLEQQDWSYVNRPTLDEFTADDWVALQPQRDAYFTRNTATRALEMLAVLKNAPSFGYPINTYEHCLQAATMVMEDGHDEATIVAALFHDIFLEISDANHGQAVAEFLHPFLSDKNYWMLRHHGYFIIHHCHSHPTVDTEARERWRNHEYFDWTVEFARKYDQISIRPDYRTAPLSEFEPMVRRLLERPVRDIPDPE